MGSMTTYVQISILNQRFSQPLNIAACGCKHFTERVRAVPCYKQKIVGSSETYIVIPIVKTFSTEICGANSNCRILVARDVSECI